MHIEQITMLPRDSHAQEQSGAQKQIFKAHSLFPAEDSKW